MTNPGEAVGDGADEVEDGGLDPTLVVLVGVLAAMGPFSIDLYLPAFGAIADDLSTGPEAVQATLSSYFFGLAVGQIVVGPVSDALGRRGPLLAGLVLYVLASLGCAAAGSAAGLVGWRAVQALGACAGTVMSRAVLRDRCSLRQMARALSLVMLVMGVAPIVAPLIGAAAGEAFGWRVLFLGLAGYGAVVGLAVAWGLPETLATPVRRSPSGVLAAYVGLFQVGPYVRHVVAGAFAQAAMFVYIGSSSFVFTRSFGLSTSAYAVVFGVNAMGLIGASQVNARWLRRTPLDVMIRRPSVAMVAASALMAVGALAPLGVLGVAVPLWCVLVCLGFVLPNTTAAAMAPVGDRAGLAAALMGTLQYGLAGVATGLAGLAFDGTAFPMACMMLVFSLGALVASWGAEVRAA